MPFLKSSPTVASSSALGITVPPVANPSPTVRPFQLTVPAPPPIQMWPPAVVREAPSFR